MQSTLAPFVLRLSRHAHEPYDSSHDVTVHKRFMLRGAKKDSFGHDFVFALFILNHFDIFEPVDIDSFANRHYPGYPGSKAEACT